MIDPIGGKYRERPLWAEFISKQALGQRQDRFASFAVSNFALAASDLFDQELAVGSLARPAVQPVADPVVVGRQRLGRSHDQRSIGPPGEFNVRREKSY